MFRPLGDTVLVADRQLHPADVARAAAEGVTMIVNNRPDGEEPGQPSGIEIEVAARAAGLGYRHLPVSGGIGPEMIEAMAAALGEGKVLAFCRSGTRSAWLWALAARSRGADRSAILAAAASAGYDLAALEPYL